MRKVLFKKYITPIHIDSNGIEHSDYTEAYKANAINKTTKITTKEGTGIISDFIFEGIFHQWSIEGDIEGTSPVAIVEMADGSIELPLASNVKFVN